MLNPEVNCKTLTIALYDKSYSYYAKHMTTYMKNYSIKCVR